MREIRGKLKRIIWLAVCAVLLANGSLQNGIISGENTLTAEAALYYEEGPEIYGAAYCVMDADTGEIICAKDATTQYYPASTTKVLTALVVVENTENLDEVLTFSEAAVTNITSDSSTMIPCAKIGERMSVRDVLYGLLLPSGNECANALAEYTAGSTEQFAELMNQRCAEIGTINSHFTNAHGLQDKDHYTCSYDMALIFAEALKNDTFREIDSAASYTIQPTNLTEQRNLTMGHKMVNGEIPYEGVYAGKTGRTPYAGRTLLTAASYKGRNIVISIMKSTDECFYIDAQILLDYTYSLIDGEEAWNEITVSDEVWASGNVNIRELPSTRSFALGMLSAGQQVERVAVCGDWSKIVINGTEAYVSSDYLLTYDPAVGPQESSEPETETAAPPAESETETETESESESESEEETSEESESSEEPETEESQSGEAESKETEDREHSEDTGEYSENESQASSEENSEDSEQISSSQDNQDQNEGKASWKVWKTVLCVVLSLILAALIVFVVIYIVEEQKRRRRRSRFKGKNFRLK